MNANTTSRSTRANPTGASATEDSRQSNKPVAEVRSSSGADVAGIHGPQPSVASDHTTSAVTGDDIAAKRIGFVYVMTNEAQPGLVKVGMCERHPYERVKDEDLANEAIPTPFVVRFYVLVDDMHRVCNDAHVALADRCVAKDFFRASIADAVNAIKQTDVKIRFSEGDSEASALVDDKHDTALGLDPTTSDAQVMDQVLTPDESFVNVVDTGDDYRPTDSASSHTIPTPQPAPASLTQHRPQRTDVDNEASQPPPAPVERSEALDRAFNQIRASRWRHGQRDRQAVDDLTPSSTTTSQSHSAPAAAPPRFDNAGTAQPHGDADNGRFFRNDLQTQSNRPFFDNAAAAPAPPPMEEPQLFRHVDNTHNTTGMADQAAGDAYAPMQGAVSSGGLSAQSPGDGTNTTAVFGGPQSHAGTQDVESWVYKREAEQILKRIRNYTLGFCLLGFVVGAIIGFAAFLYLDKAVYMAIVPWHTMGVSPLTGLTLWLATWGFVCAAIAYVISRHINRDKIDGATQLLRSGGVRR